MQLCHNCCKTFVIHKRNDSIQGCSRENFSISDVWIDRCTLHTKYTASSLNDTCSSEKYRITIRDQKKDSQLTSTDTDLLTFSYNGINSTSQITVEVVPAYSCGSGYKLGNSQQWSVNGTIGTSTHFYVTTIFITYHTMLLISHTFYIVLFINNRRGGIVVERSSRMREIGVQYPYETDLSR